MAGIRSAMTDSRFRKSRREMVMSEPRSALVVGASRGLGLGLAAELKSRGWNVVATVRDPAGEDRVKALSAKPGGEVQVEHLDINDDAGIGAVRRRLPGAAERLLSPAR